MAKPQPAFVSRTADPHQPTTPLILLDTFANLLDAPAKPTELGRLGDYRVLRMLGQGGRGLVFLAQDPHLDRRVALKVMRPEFAADAKAHARFLREARAMAAVRNDHIVTIHQVGEVRGVPFLAMEHLQGMTLESWLDRSKPLTCAQIARIGRETAQGLAAAHARGLIHRDIKPDNLWLEKPKGHVKLLDFGMTRAVGGDVHLTAKGDVVGTPAYMSPEQTRELPLDGRSDLFSLGVLLYRLCAGRLPFTAENPLALMAAIALERPHSLGRLKPDLPAELAELVMRMLAKRPEDRPASAQEVADKLLAVERGLLFPGAMPSSRTMVAVIDQKTSVTFDADDLRPPPRVPKRRRALLAMLAVAAGLAGLLVLLQVYLSHQLNTQRREAAASAVAQTGFPQLDTVLAELRTLNPQFSGHAYFLGDDNGDVVELALATDHLSLLAPLQKLRGLKKLACTGTTSGSGILADLKPLQGLPLAELDLSNNPQLADLSPLQGMKLVRLRCRGASALTDVTPLRGMPLEELSLAGTGVRDVALLKDMPLRKLWLPDPARHLTVLRQMPALEEINAQRAKQFLP